MKLLIILAFTFLPFSMVLACPPNQYQVKAHSRSGYVRYDGTVVRPTFVKAYCKDYSAAYLFVKDLFKDTPIDWPLKEDSKVWTEAEKQRVIEALEVVPEVTSLSHQPQKWTFSRTAAIKISETSEDTIKSVFGEPFLENQHGDEYTFLYKDPGTGFHRLSVRFKSNTKKVSSFLWIPTSGEKEVSLEGVMSLFPDNKFEKTIVQTKAHYLPTEGNLIDRKNGISISYRLGNKSVEGISFSENKFSRLPSEIQK